MASPDTALRIPGFVDLVHIGSGGAGTVYRATEEAFGRPVAIKVLDIGPSTEATRRAFRNECLALGPLSVHPHIVEVYSAGFVADGRPYLVMRLYARSLLEKVEATGPLPFGRVLQVGAQLASALDHAHGEGVLHRDVKLENVLFDDQSSDVALADFGIATVPGFSGGAQGLSVRYSAPEILAGGEPSEATDVFALGVLLTAAFEGALPEPGVRLAPTVVEDEPASQLDGLLWRMVSPQPDARPSTAEVLGQLQLFQSLAGLDVTRTPGPDPVLRSSTTIAWNDDEPEPRDASTRGSVRSTYASVAFGGRLRPGYVGLVLLVLLGATAGLTLGRGSGAGEGEALSSGDGVGNATTGVASTSVGPLSSAVPAASLAPRPGRSGVSARSTLSSPEEGDEVTPEVTFEGTATHPSGVQLMQIALVHIGGHQIYWNSQNANWQDRFEMNSLDVTLDADDPTSATWRFEPELPLPPGEYRFRTWARARDGTGDSTSTRTEFTVIDDGRSTEAVQTARALQDDYVVSPELVAQSLNPEAPNPYVENPDHGESVISGFRLTYRARPSQGRPISHMLVSLKSQRTSKFWNFEEDRWQDQPFDFRVEGQDLPEELRYEVEMPVDETPPGEYLATVTAVGTDGSINPVGRSNTFKVFTPS